jgi:hypothetical protein
MIRAPGDDARLSPADNQWLHSMTTAAYKVCVASPHCCSPCG